MNTKSNPFKHTNANKYVKDTDYIILWLIYYKQYIQLLILKKIIK